MFKRFLPNLGGRPRRLTQSHSLLPWAFGNLFSPLVDSAPDGLWTGIATPESTYCGCEGEQRECRDKEEPAEEPEILLEKRDIENVRLPPGQIEPYDGLSAPVNPGQQKIACQQRPTRKETQPLEEPSDVTGQNSLAPLVNVFWSESL